MVGETFTGQWYKKYDGVTFYQIYTESGTKMIKFLFETDRFDNGREWLSWMITLYRNGFNTISFEKYDLYSRYYQKAKLVEGHCVEKKYDDPELFWGVVERRIKRCNAEFKPLGLLEIEETTPDGYYYGI